MISGVAGVHDALVGEARQGVIARIDGLTAALTQDVAKLGGDAALRSACVRPLESLKAQVRQDESVAHIAQAEAEAVKAFDAGVARVEEFVRSQAGKPAEGNGAAVPTVKSQKVIRPADLAHSPYLETQADVDAFLAALRLELEKAISNNERIQIR